MDRIPIITTPHQVFSITLGGQQCRIAVRQLSTGVYLDLTANGVRVLASRICRDRVRLVRADYLPFSGNLVFIDTQGKQDPDYTGFGARFQLVYEP